MYVVLSPISKNKSVFLLNIPSKDIILFYKKEMNMDVSKYFADTDAVGLYQCPDTLYRHFYPNNLAGDGKFYEELQKYPWYYNDWKWDYDEAIGAIEEGSKVLDIGCGSGKFLKHLKEKKNCDCTGLELNENAVAEATRNGLKVKSEFVQDHALNEANRYDIVCAFQVLEHIADAGSFLEAAIKCLNPNGKLIICVPNNNPWFYQNDKLHTLNLPPHHMNMWNRESLSKLADYYGFKHVQINEESVTRYRLFARKKLEADKSPLSKMLYPVLYPIVSFTTYLNRKNIKAGSILAIFSGFQNTKTDV